MHRQNGHPNAPLTARSLAGRNVRRLPVWRALSDLPSNLLLELRTPAEWRPDAFQPAESDKFGRFRTRAGALDESMGVDEHGIVTQVRRTLDDDHKHHKKQKHLPKHQQKKVGGVYAHHFFGLASELRSNLNDQIVHEEEEQGLVLDGLLKQQQRDLKPILNIHPGEHEHAEGAVAEDPAADDEAPPEVPDVEEGTTILQEKEARKMRNKEVISRFEVLGFKVALAALRLQRIWRARILSRALRLSNKRHRAALNIQRFMRGCYGRAFQKLYKIVTHMAAAKIQSHYKALMIYRMVRAYRALVVAATVRVQAIMRGYLCKSYIEYVRIPPPLCVPVVAAAPRLLTHLPSTPCLRRATDNREWSVGESYSAGFPWISRPTITQALGAVGLRPDPDWLVRGDNAAASSTLRCPCQVRPNGSGACGPGDRPPRGHHAGTHLLRLQGAMQGG